MKTLPYRLSLRGVGRQLLQMSCGQRERKILHLVFLRREGLVDPINVQRLIAKFQPSEIELLKIIATANTEERLFVIAEYVRELRQYHELEDPAELKYSLNRRLREIYHLRQLPPNKQL